MTNVIAFEPAAERVLQQRLLAELAEMRARCQYIRRSRRDCPWLCVQTWTVMHGEGGSSVEAFYLANRDTVWRPFAVVFLHTLALAATDPTWSVSNARSILDKYVAPTFADAGLRFRPGSMAA